MSKIMAVIAAVSALIAGLSLWVSSQTAKQMEQVRRDHELTMLQLQQELTALQSRRNEPAPTPIVLRTDNQTAAQPQDPEPDSTSPPEPSEQESYRRHQQTLVMEFQEMSARDRRRALRDLAFLAAEGDLRARQLILDSLHDQDENLREEAVESIARIRDPSLFPNLAAMVNDPAGDVREEVAQAMSSMPVDQSGPVLTEMLADRNSEVVEEVLESLARVEYRDAVPQVLQLTQTDRLDLVARAGQTLRALGATAESAQALQRLTAGLNSADALDRMMTIRHLRRFGGDEAIARLEAIAAHDPSPAVRDAALNALDRMW